MWSAICARNKKPFLRIVLAAVTLAPSIKTSDDSSCTNVAVSSSPCPDKRNFKLSGLCSGFCTTCWLVSKRFSSVGPGVCSFQGCTRTACLEHSSHCKECLLSKANLVIDPRDQATVVVYEQEKARKKIPATHTILESEECLQSMLPRKHSDFFHHDQKAIFLPWNHCPLCGIEIVVSNTSEFQSQFLIHVADGHGLQSNFRKK